MFIFYSFCSFFGQCWQIIYTFCYHSFTYFLSKWIAGNRLGNVSQTSTPCLFLGLRAVALQGAFFTTLFLLLTGTPVHLLKTTGFFVGLKRKNEGFGSTEK